MQAATIMQAMIDQRQSDELADAFLEAYDRGPAWREAIRGLSRLEEGSRAEIRSALAETVRQLGRDPAKLDLEN